MYGRGCRGISPPPTPKGKLSTPPLTPRPSPSLIGFQCTLVHVCRPDETRTDGCVVEWLRVVRLQSGVLERREVVLEEVDTPHPPICPPGSRVRVPCLLSFVVPLPSSRVEREDRGVESVEADVHLEVGQQEFVDSPVHPSTRHLLSGRSPARPGVPRFRDPRPHPSGSTPVLGARGGPWRTSRRGGRGGVCVSPGRGSPFAGGGRDHYPSPTVRPWTWKELVLKGP